jgi:hypothetical protein
MRLPTLSEDYWQLLSAEESHRRNPSTFWIPSLDARSSLQRGQAAKLMFEIEADEDGSVDRGVERMWVLITERVGEIYIGVLVNTPSLDAPDEFHLRLGAEVPFLPEHIIDIDDPPQDFVEQVLAREPSRRWPR